MSANERNMFIASRFWIQPPQCLLGCQIALVVLLNKWCWWWWYYSCWCVPGKLCQESWEKAEESEIFFLQFHDKSNEMLAKFCKKPQN